MPPMPNPTGKRRPKRRHPGEGTVVRRKDRWRAKPWAAVVPYLDEQGVKRTMWLSAASRDEAERIRKAEVARIAKGIRPTEETVGTYVAAWLLTVDVGPGTWPTYHGHLTERIAPTLGKVYLDDLNPSKVRTAMKGWSGAPATRHGTLRLLRAAMKQAVADRLIEHDPTAGIPYPRIPAHEPVTLTAEEARHLMESVKGERFGPIVCVTLGLGLRRGETLGLRTPDVDFHAGEVAIGWQLRYISPSQRAEGDDRYAIRRPKGDKVRTVPMPDFVADALRARIAERDQERADAKVYAPNDLVFCKPNGNNIPVSTLDNWWKGALKRAGLPDMRFHDLRASTLTLLVDMGVDLFTVQRIAGHADLDTTRRYVGKTPGAMTGAAQRIGEALG